jgi:hypothetical protein
MLEKLEQYGDYIAHEQRIPGKDRFHHIKLIEVAADERREVHRIPYSDVTFSRKLESGGWEIWMPTSYWRNVRIPYRENACYLLRLYEDERGLVVGAERSSLWPAIKLHHQNEDGRVRLSVSDEIVFSPPNPF